MRNWLDHSRKGPGQGQGGYFYTSPTEGTTIHFTPGFLDLLKRFGRWLFTFAGWILFILSNWVQRGP